MQFDLERFYSAQNSDNLHYNYSITNYDSAIKELKSGKKESHWIWYIFPQLKGLGNSYKSNFYGISGIEEATEYLAHPLLSERLFNCTQIILEMNDDLFNVMHNDEKKVHACMTLFSRANNHHSDLFDKVIEKHFKNELNSRTLELLGV